MGVAYSPPGTLWFPIGALPCGVRIVPTAGEPAAGGGDVLLLESGVDAPLLESGDRILIEV